NRHDRVLDIRAGNGMLVWEAFRRVPEGGVWGLVTDEKNFEFLSAYVSTLPEVERPGLIKSDISSFQPEIYPGFHKNFRFEAIIGRNVFTRAEDKRKIFEKIFTLLTPGGRLSIAETIPSKAQRLSALVNLAQLSPDIVERYKKAEDAVYSAVHDPLVNWDENTLSVLGEEAGFVNRRLTTKQYTEYRTITAKDLERWLAIDRDRFGYGKIISEHLSPDEFAVIREILFRELENARVTWQVYAAFLSSSKPA
ncbi:MAG: hypothetical protein AB1798_00390, partial [Spirochaetota bacterium]